MAKVNPVTEEEVTQEVVLDTTPAGGITEGSNNPGTYELPNGTVIINY